jgi:putative transposase
MKKSRYTDTQIVNILKQNQAGESTANLCREYDMSQATFYKWRSKYGDADVNRDLCINRNNHQKPTFHPLGDFLNPALALLGQGLKKSPIGQKLDFANHPYLCKGL